MRTELEQGDIDRIAFKVVEMLRPHLGGNGKAPQEEVMDVEGLAGYLKCTRSWVHQNHKALRIPSVRIGNQLRFRRSEVDRWLKAQEAR